MNNTNENNDAEASVSDKVELLQALVDGGIFNMQAANDIAGRVEFKTDSEGRPVYTAGDIVTGDVNLLIKQFKETMPSYFNGSGPNAMQQDQGQQVDDSNPVFAFRQATANQKYPGHFNMKTFRQIRNSQGAHFRLI